MDITFLGHASFLIKTKTASLVTDPFDPQMVGLKYPRVKADIVTVSHDHQDHNQVDQVSEVKKVLRQPGEYEIQGISFIALPSWHDSEKGQKRGPNTIFIIEAENLRLVHLGDLGHVLNEKIVDQIGEVDVLMVPIGGEYTIGPKEAMEVVSALEPKIILPMHFQMPGLNPETFAKLTGIEDFLAQDGMKQERLPRLKLTAGSLPEEQTVVILEKR